MRSVTAVTACLGLSLALGLLVKTPINHKNKASFHRYLVRPSSSDIDSSDKVPVQSLDHVKQNLFSTIVSTAAVFMAVAMPKLAANADDKAELAIAEPPVAAEVATKEIFDMGAFKLPYNHENLLFKDFLGKKATIVFNMKIDDPQTVTQFPNLLEIYKKYAKDGLNVHAFPTEQGWFEPDDDETVRAKSIEYYGFGNYPTSVVFDKVDLLGPSAHPLYSALTKTLLTPNGYGRITLNYEKFLLDAKGTRTHRLKLPTTDRFLVINTSNPSLI